MIMEKDLGHALSLLHILREAGLKPQTIESATKYMPLEDIEKRTISILNRGQAKESMKFPNSDLRYYFCYETTRGDCRKEFGPSNLLPYTAQIGNISYN